MSVCQGCQIIFSKKGQTFAKIQRQRRKKTPGKKGQYRDKEGKTQPKKAKLETFGPKKAKLTTLVHASVLSSKIQVQASNGNVAKQ